MRPVNLIPPDERRGDSAPLRTGNLIYVLVAGLALLVLGIVALALTGKQISDRQDHKASLEQELSQEAVRASTLAAFTNFRTVQESRAATVTSLADSRFDWNRVLHELSLVLPSDVSLSCLTGTAAPDVEIESTCSTGAAVRLPHRRGLRQGPDTADRHRGPVGALRRRSGNGRRSVTGRRCTDPEPGERRQGVGQ